MSTMSRPPRDVGVGTRKTFEELAHDQGVKLPQDRAAIIGAGAELWESDAELDAFLQGIQDRKRESLAGTAGDGG